MPDERQFIILSERISVSTNSRKTKRQHMEHAEARELRWRRGRYFYFRVTSAILFFLYGDHYPSVSDIRSMDWAPRKM